jgi:hypothetical protein
MAARDDKRRQQIAVTPALRIGELVAEHGSYRAVSSAIGIDHVYLHRVAKGSRQASPQLLKLLGLEKRVTYVRAVA